MQIDKVQIEKDLSIDKHSLDEAWVNHPITVFHYNELAVEAEQVLERIELKKDTIIAELDEQIRSTGNKMTVDGMKNWIIRQPDYQSVEEERIRAQYEVNMLKAAVKALEHKRKGLEKLVDLYLSSYYAEPKRSSGEAYITGKVQAEFEKSMSKRKGE